MNQPTLTTERLVLRPLDEHDAHDVQLLAGDRAIADTTLTIPHPYEDGMAEQWIAEQRDQSEAGTHVLFAIELAAEKRLVGAISLKIDREFSRAELGYWVGKPFWNRGYATEAARRTVRYAFEELGLNRIASRHLVRNPASGRVMQKIGMQKEGTLREDTVKWGRFEDLHLYGLLRSEWQSPDSES